MSRVYQWKQVAERNREDLGKQDQENEKPRCWMDHPHAQFDGRTWGRRTVGI